MSETSRRKLNAVEGKAIMESDDILSILLLFLFLGPSVSVFIIIYCFNLDQMLVHKIKQTYSMVKIDVMTNDITLSRFFTTLLIGYNTHNDILYNNLYSSSKMINIVPQQYRFNVN